MGAGCVSGVISLCKVCGDSSFLFVFLLLLYLLLPYLSIVFVVLDWEGGTEREMWGTGLGFLVAADDAVFLEQR